jgi:pilus assembly protein Flp/PilA
MRHVRKAYDRFIARQFGELRAIGFSREEGQALVEYALILGLIALVVIGVVTSLGTEVSSAFSSIVASL